MRRDESEQRCWIKTRLDQSAARIRLHEQVRRQLVDDRRLFDPRDRRASRGLARRDDHEQFAGASAFA
jgi:hypothetical protein